MTLPISSRDWELLSAYLDGQLSPKERTRLETRLWEDKSLRDALDELDRTRTALRSLPRLRTPRNFTISPEQATVKPFPRLHPLFGFASALAVVMLLTLLVGDFLGVLAPSRAGIALVQPTSTELIIPEAFAVASPTSAISTEPLLVGTESGVSPQAKLAPAPSETNDFLSLAAPPLPSPTPDETPTEAPTPTGEVIMLEITMDRLTDTPAAKIGDVTGDASPSATEVPVGPEGAIPTLTDTATPTSTCTETASPTPTETATPTASLALQGTNIILPTTTQTTPPTASPAPLSKITPGPMPTDGPLQPGKSSYLWLRMVEILLASFAVITGVAAWLLWRRGRQF